MKHAEHIIAFTSGILDHLGISGKAYTPCDGEMVEKLFSANGHLVIARRLELDAKEKTKEFDGGYRQMLPYIVLKDSNDRIFAYQRGKGVGESRLAGEKSIGFGGHVDLLDLSFDANSVVNIHQTFIRGMIREITEELCFLDNRGIPVYGEALMSVASFGILGLINDETNNVGRDHLGIAVGIEVPEGFTVRVVDQELVELGWVDAGQIVDESMDSEHAIGEFENWSKILLEELTKK